MKPRTHFCPLKVAVMGVCLIAGAILLGLAVPANAGPRFPRWNWLHRTPDYQCRSGYYADSAGTWYWMRSPEQEQRMAASLYNRYCIRCHGVDGRGVWDIPDVPNFTNARWQASRSDGELVRVTLEGRGAVMPPFRGAISLEEAWALARYLRTLVPGTEFSRPDYSSPESPAGPPPPPPASPGPTLEVPPAPPASPDVPPVR